MEQSIKDIVERLETPTAVSAQFTKLLNSLSGLRIISNLSNQYLNYEELIDAMMKSTYEHLEAEEASLYLLEDNSLNCVSHLNWECFSKNHSSIKNKNHSSLLSAGYIGQAATDRNVVHIENCNLSDEKMAHYKTHNKEIGSLICAPLLINDTVFGVVELAHPAPNHFNSWQEHSVTIYTDLMASLLNNHKLMHDMQNIVDLQTKELSNALEESEKLRARYEEMAVIDPLTKLYNRRYFYTEIASGLANAKRYSQTFSLMLMDLDHFKQVNDSFGHQCGDMVLIDVSEVLSQFTREGDTLARIGGEAFVLALPQTNNEGAHKLAERIISTIQNKDWRCNGKKVEITISIGLSTLIPKNDDSSFDDDFQVNDLIREADRALYFVKEHGRNSVKSYSEI